MWPFSKIKSDCMSSVLTCDGKHHTFTVWEDIVLERKAYIRGMTEPMTYSTNGQDRTCVICHYRERRMTDED